MSTVFDEAVLEDRPEVDLSILAASLRAEREQVIVLGLDVGTSGARAALFDDQRNQIEGSEVSLSNDFAALLTGGDTDADAMLEFVTRLIDVAVARAESFVSRIDYVASSCFWHSLTAVDDKGRAVTPLLGWADTRAVSASDELRSEIDEAETHRRTGARFHPSYWPAKLFWLKRDRPELFAKAARWLSFSDYLFLKLFGDATTSVSMASATGLFNQHRCDWDSKLIERLGLSIDQFPAIAQSGKTFKQLSDDYSFRWPLLERAAWFPAIGDGAANNIGASCVTTERATLMIGTSGAMRVLFPGTAPETLPPELFCYRADRNRVVIGGALSDGGGLFRWLKQSLVVDSEDLKSQLDAIDPDAHGLTVLPFWSGERSTGWDGAAKGSIVGLTAGTRPIEILRAGMEAICYRFAILANALEQIAPQATIVAAGNALRSLPAWAQMLADVLGRRITMSAIDQASMRGAALLALEAIGKIDSLETIESADGEIYEPDFVRHEVYARAIGRQQELYEKLIGGFNFQV